MSKTNAIALAVAALAGLAVYLFARKPAYVGTAEWGPIEHVNADGINLGNPTPAVGGGLVQAGTEQYQSQTGFTEAEEWEALNRYRFPSLLPSGDYRITI